MPLPRQMPGELSGSIEQQRRQANKTLTHPLRQIRQDRVNGEFDSSRDASVCGDGAIPSILEPRRNKLRGTSNPDRGRNRVDR
jgi:hypothetical protein